MLYDLTDFCVKATKETVDKHGANWTKLDRETSVTFTRATFKQSVIFPLRTVSLNLGIKYLRGSWNSHGFGLLHFLVNLFLYYY